MNNTSVKITIRHTQASVDPSATYSDEEFETVIEALESEYTNELRKSFPNAEIEFLREDFTYSSEIHGIDDFEDLENAQTEVQEILESVYETGNFWA